VITSSHSISSAICGITFFNNDEISRHFEEVIELIFFHSSWLTGKAVVGIKALFLALSLSNRMLTIFRGRAGFEREDGEQGQKFLFKY